MAQPWSDDQNNLMSTHMANLSCTQQNPSSVDGVIITNQPNTLDPIASTNDSVDNSIDPDGSRVVLDSDGNTVVHDTPSVGTMSTLLGSVSLSNVNSWLIMTQ